MASRGAPTPSRSDTSGPTSQSRASRRTRLIAGNLTRVLVLAAIVIGTGAAAGMAVAYPLKSLDLGGNDGVTLDQEALSGTIDAEQALVTLADLPKTYTEADSSAGMPKLIDANYCGGTVSVGEQVGDRLVKAYVDKQNTSFMLTEVVKVRRQNDAGKYVREMSSLFDGCEHQRFFRTDGNKEQVKISDDRRDEPLAADYVSRTLSPVKGGPINIVTYFQVGNVIVAIEYAGPANPPKTLMRNAELEVLYRVAPAQLSKTAKVKGSKPVPDDGTTTTAVDVVQASPTSSPPLPTTIAPPPTFEPPTTTRVLRRRPTTTAAGAAAGGAPGAGGTAQTQPAVTAAPGH